MANLTTMKPSLHYVMDTTYDQCMFLSQPADYTQEFYTTYMAILVINCLIFLPTILGNFVIVLGIWITPALQTVPNILLIGLACSDLGVGLIVPALNIARIVPKLQGSSFDSWCTVQVAYTFFGVMFCGVSFLTVASLTIDKYLALHWHLRYAAIVTTKKVIYLLLSFWVIFGAMSTIQIWSMTVYRVSVCVVVPVFLLGTSVTYYRIYRVLRKHSVQIQTQSKIMPWQGDGNTTCDALNMARYRKSVTSMFLVYCLFVLCYIPYICVQFTVLCATLRHSNDSHDDDLSYKRLYVAVDVTETIVILNSFLNPIIYCWRMREIRHAAKRVLLIIRFRTVVHPFPDPSRAS